MKTWLLPSVLLSTLLGACDKDTTTSPVSTPPDTVKWSVDLGWGGGVKGLAKDTSLRGYVSGTVSGRIQGFSRNAMRDTLVIGTNIGKSAKVPLSDSGTFRFQALDVLQVDNMTIVRIAPTALAGKVLSPTMVSIVYSNY